MTLIAIVGGRFSDDDTVVREHSLLDYATQVSYCVSLESSNARIDDHCVRTLALRPNNSVAIFPFAVAPASVTLTDSSFTQQQQHDYGSLVKLNSDNDDGSEQEFGWPEKRDFDVAATSYAGQNGSAAEDDLKLLNLSVTGVPSADENGNPFDNAMLTWSGNKIKVYKDSHKGEAISSGTPFHSEGQVYVEGVNLSEKLKEITITAQALDKGTVVKGAKSELDLAVGPILQNLFVKTVGKTGVKQGPNGPVITSRVTKDPAATFIAKYLGPDDWIESSTGYVQNIYIANTLPDVTAAKRGNNSWRFGFGKVADVGPDGAETIDYFGQTLVDQPLFDAGKVPLYELQPEVKNGVRKDNDSPFLGFGEVAPLPNFPDNKTTIGMSWLFDLFAVQTLGGTIYPLGIAKWRVVWDGTITRGANGYRYSGLGAVRAGDWQPTHRKPDALGPVIANEAIYDFQDGGWRVS